MTTDIRTPSGLEDDEIMTPIRTNREQLAARFGYDPVRLQEYFEAEAARQVPSSGESRPAVSIASR